MSQLEFPQLDTIEKQWKFFKQSINSLEKKQIKLKTTTWEYWLCGSGKKTLILFHGAMIGPEMWFYPCHILKKEYRIIIPFIPNDLASVSQVLQLYQEILKQEKIKHSTIIGYSYGGGLVQALIEFLPHKIDRVVLTHTGLLWGRERVPSMRLLKILLKITPLSLLKSILKKKRIEQYPDSSWNQFHYEYFMQRMDNLQKKALQAYLVGSADFLADYLKQPSRPITFKGPVILLGTEGDKDTFYAMRTFEQIFPHALKHVFTESGGHHFIFLQPEKYTQKMYALLKQTD